MLYEMTIPQFSKVLGNLLGFLDKAAQFADHKKFDIDILLHSRLSPDQFHFIKQVQIACDVAKFAAARLTGATAPKNEDNEKTLADIRARIEFTIKYLSTVSAKDFAGAESKAVTTAQWDGKTMKGSDFVIQAALPNFYFHITTAYAILRHNGVDLGKKDFLGNLSFNK